AGKNRDYSRFKDYILYPYLEYEYLINNLSSTSSETMERFIQRYANSPLSRQLGIHLAQRNNDEKRWDQTFLQYQTEPSTIKARCLHLEARIALGDEANALPAAKTLWMSGRDRPRQCDALFTKLKQLNQLTPDDYWERIGLAIDKGATSLAKSLAKQLKRSDRKLTKTWISARSKPKKALKRRTLKKDTAHTRDVVAYAIKRIARQDTDQAKAAFRRASRKYKFDTSQQAEINRYIAIRDALDHKPHALMSLSSVPETFQNQKTKEWITRLAVRQGNWKTALAAINSMPTDKQNANVWTYWKARCLEATQQRAAARALYQSITDSASFYGFLAADHLNQPYDMLKYRHPELGLAVPELAKKAGIQRALQLLALDMKAAGRAEWFHSLDPSNKLQMLAATKLAQDNGFYFTSILTLSKAKEWDQIELRFPMAYEPLVRTEASEQGVSPALVYGVIRRESAFDPNIVSSAKAQGLMQLIPPTARQVRRGLGLKPFSKKQVFEPDMNIKLGTAYLNTLLNRFEMNYALATASYNAGPHRMPKWAPDYPLEAARWVESIPFNETRNYVQAVLGYMTIYEYKLNGGNEAKVTRLSHRLNPIKPSYDR
ncbi:MAG: transglycosylase SLT domain-containing protein, partial [Leucothrix sp.]